MNLLLLHNDDFIEDSRVRLHDRRLTHIQNVLSAVPGQSLQVGLINGKIGSGTILNISPDYIELDVRLDRQPPKPLPVTLILAMPRPKVFKRVLQAVTGFGIKKIILINTWRVDKSYWQSPVLGTAFLQEQFILGLEQSRDTVLPIVEIQRRFKPFVEDHLPAICNNTLALVAHPVSAQPCPANVEHDMSLAIGPEGGFTSYEIGKLEEAGMMPVHIGNRPLKVEAAIPALLGRLSPCFG